MMKRNNSVNDLIFAVENKIRYKVALETISFDAKLPDGDTLSDKIYKCNKIIEQIKNELLFGE